MSLFSIDGLISGLDTTEIIEGLLDAERAPIRRAEAQQAQTNQKISAFQNLNARLLSLRVSAQRLQAVDTFRGRGVQSSDTDLVNASVNSTAEPATHSIVVSDLAKAHQFASDSFQASDEELGFAGDILVNGRAINIESNDDLSDIATKINNAVSDVRASVVRVDEGDYRLSVQRATTGATEVELADANGSGVLVSLGLVDGVEALKDAEANLAKSDGLSDTDVAVGTLLNLTSSPSGTVSFDADNPFSIDIDLATDSLEDIVDKFNAAKGASDFSISIVEEEDAGGNTVQRLQVESASGVDAADFTDDGNVLETLGFLASGVKNENQAAQDARVTINGIEIFRPTNNINDVIPGVSIFLSDADVSKTVTLTVSRNNSGASDAIQRFVNDYNNVIGFLRENASYDSETESRGVLLGDSTVLSVQSSLFRLTQAQVPELPSTALSALNNGAGVRAGSITLTNRAGNSMTLDLSAAATVQDVLDAINTSGLKVNASVNGAGTGLILTDNSGGTGTLRIEEDGGFTAADLGIVGEANSNTFYGTALTAGGKLNLSAIGISSTSTGTLTLDQTKLAQALENNFDEVVALFQTDDSGVADLAVDQLDYLTNASDGQIKAKTDGLQATIDRLDDDIERYEDRVERVELRLRLQFATLESTLAELQTEGEYILNQLNQLNNNNNR